MKIVNRKKFMSMPAGTVFSKYRSCIFGSLCIKGDNCHNDFYAQQINEAIDYNDTGEFFDKLLSAEKNGDSLNLDFDCEGRDGLFNPDQLFAIWEKRDVIALIKRFQKAVEDSLLNIDVQPLMSPGDQN